MTRPHSTDRTGIRRFPEPTALRFDPRTRRIDGGRTLIGGAPLRVLRLSERGAAVVDRWRDGDTVGAADGHQRLARRLVDAGLAHPTIDPRAAPPCTVGVVIPVRDDPDVVATVRALGADDRIAEVVVVDDGSLDADGLASDVALAAAEVPGRIRLERRATPGGPAAARNTGWPLVDGDVVAFVDANVVPDGDWLSPLVAHFADPSVVAVAPRVVPRLAGSRSRGAATTVLDRYEAASSPLDMGPDPARVAAGGRVTYVPSTALLIRRTALTEADGFDESLRYGEDVDLVWRLVEAGGDVRYEPTATVTHPNRPRWAGMLRQRFAYGSAAAALDRRYPGRVAPVAANAWSLGAWGLAAVGGRRGMALGAGVAAASSGALVPKLRGRVDHPVTEAARLGAAGHLWSGVGLARAGLRPWLPLLAAAALVSRRARRLLVSLAVGVPLGDWLVTRPRLDPLRWALARLADDAAYNAGVWSGCREHGRVGPLLPGSGRIEGLGRRSEPGEP